MPPQNGRRRGVRGFTLIEAAMTTAIIGIGVVALLELLATGTRSNVNASELVTATNLAGKIDITAKNLTVSGATANNKVYDGGTIATINAGSATTVGLVSGDAVTLNTGSATGAFANANVGTSKAVTVSGLTLSGADAGNYTLTQPAVTANITPATITVTADNEKAERAAQRQLQQQQKQKQPAGKDAKPPRRP